jgi:hypothetical protein
MKRRHVLEAFLDGFSPVDNLFERPVRPGSDANLIANPLVSDEFERILHLAQEEKEVETRWPVPNAAAMLHDEGYRQAAR